MVAGGRGGSPAPAGVQSDPSQASVAAALAARVPTDRAAVIHPALTDDPLAVPVYPPGTSVEIDETTWVDHEPTASAYATVSPPGQQVLVLFARYRGQLYVAQIEQARS